MDFAAALTAMARVLRPGGRLAVVGLAADKSVADLLAAAPGVPVNLFYRAIYRQGESGAPIMDPDMSWREVRVAAARLLPGVRYRRHLAWNGKIGNDLDVEGTAPVKKPADYKVVGTSPKRRDVAAKVLAQPAAYVTDIRLPGMLHARVIRPPVAGAVLTSVDEGSVRDIPGVRIVQKKTFSPWSRKRNGTRCAPRHSSRRAGRRCRPPSPTPPRSTITFARRRCGSARSKARKAPSIKRCRARPR